MFSFGAYYMRDPMKKKCYVFIKKSEDWEHVMGHCDYYGEAIYVDRRDEERREV